uniref:Myomegalin n=1 Tax=Callorhinchus milii TaxID=7868 RepID=A0A4W3K763_CALMI
MELQYSASDPNPGSPSEPRVKSCLRKGLSVEDFGRCSDVALLQQHVQSLKAQLSKSDKIIHNLQCRVRSISTTSDYASSVERPHGEHPHFAATQPNDEDLWQTDSAEHFQVTAQPSTEIKQLIQRVTSLEAQLKSAKLMGPSAKNTTWPGKYDSLIQAQARELSHLRQKMREGKSIGQILKQHLSDTTKSFEELLRANDIDYYMGQSFRDQLSQGCQMAEKVVHKLTGRDISNLSNKGDQEVLVVRLSKELQHKNKTIESLHAKLQTRSETPCSSRTLSESEPSDRASFVSDDQVSTNDELDAYREELESASDYSQDDQRSAEHEAKVMTGVGLSEHSVKAVPTDLSFSGASTSSSLQLDAAGYVSQCHSAPRQELAGSGELKDILRAANSYLDSSAMWETARRPTMLGDISSGSSGYQSGSNLTGTDLLEEHLREIRSLRQRLEESICTNDRLRQQLEVRLAAAAKESAGAPTSIYIQGLETMTQLTEENRKLRDENLTIEARLALIPRGTTRHNCSSSLCHAQQKWDTQK